MAILSVKNVNKRSNLSFVKFKRVFNIALIPVLVTTLKGLWTGSDVQLNKILLIITVTLPGIMEVIGMLTADDPIQIDTNDIQSVDFKKTAAPNDNELNPKP
jgi:hypothetical protein